MKPSEKIYKIYERICKEHNCSPGSEMASDYEYHNAAIVEYLDEQAEGSSRTSQENRKVY